MGRWLPQRLKFLAGWLALGACLSAGAGNAAEAVESAQLSDQELEALVGPVALYPDDLLAIVLPASTNPLQVVQAARYLEKLEADPSVSAGEDWDESVVALLNYPEALSLLNDDLDWTWELGQAVLHQEQALIAAVERFRLAAHDAGNLVSDDRQRVSVVEDGIHIRPANPEVIYVPYYQPALVRTYQRSPVYYYHSRPYPVYYYPYTAGHYFSDRHFWGVTSVYSIGWQTRNVRYHLHQHRSHPYHGRKYAYDHHRYWRARSTLRHRDHTALRQHPRHHWRAHGPRQGARPNSRRQEYQRPARRTEPAPRTRPQTQTRTRQWAAGRGEPQRRSAPPAAARARAQAQAREARVQATQNRETRSQPTQSARQWGNAREGARSFSRGRHPQ